MTQDVLTFMGAGIPCQAMCKLPEIELVDQTEKQKRTTFDNMIKSKIGDFITLPPKSLSSEPDLYIDIDYPRFDSLPRDTGPVDSNGTTTFDQPMINHQINLEVRLPQGEENKHDKVIGRSKDTDDNIDGTYDNNQFANTLVYDMQFPTCEIKKYAANAIATNIYNQVDIDEHSRNHLDNIIDYRINDNAVERDNIHTTTKIVSVGRQKY